MNKKELMKEIEKSIDNEIRQEDIEASESVGASSGLIVLIFFLLIIGSILLGLNL